MVALKLKVVDCTWRHIGQVCFRRTTFSYGTCAPKQLFICSSRRLCALKSQINLADFSISEFITKTPLHMLPSLFLMKLQVRVPGEMREAEVRKVHFVP